MNRRVGINPFSDTHFCNDYSLQLLWSLKKFDGLVSDYDIHLRRHRIQVRLLTGLVNLDNDDLEYGILDVW